MFNTVREDIRTVFNKDPAARSVLEVLCCYPGLHAVWNHRCAQFFWNHRMRFLGRLFSQWSRFFTGIEIHPGAKIGRRFFIDHGMGVVIGETAEIGDDVLMYKGVVLGGTSLNKGKRHPTIGNEVVLGTNAVVLGPIHIGDCARVGSGSVVVKSVPPGATVVGIPGRTIEDQHHPLLDLEHGQLPDPVAEAIRLVLREQEKLSDRVRGLETISGLETPVNGFKEEHKTVVKEFSQGGGI